MSQDQLISSDLLTLYTLAQKHKQVREGLGYSDSLNIDGEEQKFETSKLVEEYMVIANTLTTYFLESKKKEIRPLMDKFTKLKCKFKKWE